MASDSTVRSAQERWIINFRTHVGPDAHTAPRRETQLAALLSLIDGSAR